MKSMVVIPAAVALATILLIGGAYAYNSMHSDDLAPQEIKETYATLTVDGLSQNITVSGENLVFGTALTLKVSYHDTENNDCYINLAITGVGANNLVKISLVQEYETTSKTFSGSAFADADGNVAINGFGLIKEGDFTVFGTITGESPNASILGMTFTVYPQP